jgi:hypothetical protein
MTLERAQALAKANQKLNRTTKSWCNLYFYEEVRGSGDFRVSSDCHPKHVNYSEEGILRL